MRGAELHLPAGTWDQVTPESAGWTYCGLRVVHLGELVLETGEHEFAVLPLAGGLTVDVDGRRFELAGRESVFSRVSDWAYLPLGSSARLAGEAEVALASARAERRFEPAYVPAEAVPVEIRGAGTATRQVVNFMSPEGFAAADRLICVEVLTPDGNWSSYPPHKHDDTPDSLANNEEIYYRAGRTGAAARARTASRSTARTRRTARSTPRSSSATATFSSSRAATTVPASPRRATPSTTSTSWPARTPSGRWRSSMIRRTPGCGRAGRRWRPIPGAADHRRMRPRVGIAVIGFGWMGQAHSRSYLRLPTLFDGLAAAPELVVCADNVEARREQAVARFEFREAVPDWRHAIERLDVDVVVTAPNMLHVEIVEAACAAGKHVFCEKPVGGTPSQTARAAAAARDAGVITGVGYNYRFAPLVAYTKQPVDEGRLGAIVSYRGRFFSMYGSDPLLS